VVNLICFGNSPLAIMSYIADLLNAVFLITSGKRRIEAPIYSTLPMLAVVSGKPQVTKMKFTYAK